MRQGRRPRIEPIGSPKEGRSRRAPRASRRHLYCRRPGDPGGGDRPAPAGTGGRPARRRRRRDRRGARRPDRPRPRRPPARRDPCRRRPRARPRRRSVGLLARLGAGDPGRAHAGRRRVRPLRAARHRDHRPRRRRDRARERPLARPARLAAADHLVRRRAPRRPRAPSIPGARRRPRRARAGGLAGGVRPDPRLQRASGAPRRDHPRGDAPGLSGRWIVQVVDNNTRDEAVWRPIEALCAELGERVRFIHLADWPGYKSGALNEATRRLPGWVDVIAVVDADYLVEPGFLRATARHFADPDVAFVQTPQHYRDWSDDRYLAGLFYSYKYFFDVSMVSRAEHNAIIFGGTMGLVRREALERIGGWDEWCITEDAEASLRLLGLGYRGVYDPRSYGAGLMPLSFEGLKKQRFRWAFGGVQILRKHAGALLRMRGGALRLTTGQRIAYLTGALQWFNEVLGALFTGLLLTAAVASALGGHIGLPALSGAALVVPPLLIVTGAVRSQWGLRRTAGCSRGEALRAHLVWFALSWVVARACLSALVRR
ncbi:MAG: glycosyltransferase, partial [Chloroflexi bacterium]